MVKVGMRVEKSTRDKIMKIKEKENLKDADAVLKKYLKLPLTVLCFIFLIGFSSALTYVDHCQDLNVEGETYMQNASIEDPMSEEDEWCIRISGNNTIFDGNGYYIDYSGYYFEYGYAINLGGNNNTIMNVIQKGGSDPTHPYGLYNEGGIGSPNIVKDSTFESKFGGIQGRLTAINISYTHEVVFTDLVLTKQWYFNAQANYSFTKLPVSGATVKAFDNTGTQAFSVLTGSNGKIAQQVLTEYVNNGGTKTYYSNYTINSTKGSETVYYSRNITTNTFQQIWMSRRNYIPGTPKWEIIREVWRNPIIESRFPRLYVYQLYSI
jgi:hypothetical protein